MTDKGNQMIRPKADKNASEAQNLYFEPLDGLIVVEGNDWSQYIIGQGNLDRLNHQSFLCFPFFGRGGRGGQIGHAPSQPTIARPSSDYFRKWG